MNEIKDNIKLAQDKALQLLKRNLYVETKQVEDDIEYTILNFVVSTYDLNNYYKLFHNLISLKYAIIDEDYVFYIRFEDDSDNGRYEREVKIDEKDIFNFIHILDSITPIHKIIKNNLQKYLDGNITILYNCNDIIIVSKDVKKDIDEYDINRVIINTYEGISLQVYYYNTNIHDAIQLDYVNFNINQEIISSILLKFFKNSENINFLV